ncbi:MAG: hypothetical protein QF492_02635 [Candidatus Krumholzibacteria bacterium]|jgi:dolichol kinase|nr:hypothetical protein [Candidatus Krumholzibacteria bacterium]MDP6796800.1 hypothetical protein [Candidatus Krumholzibacteria bacterium]MDP7020921.1 hypothetical protein [Candidatus Krumholzibacteria bacterium]
MKLGEPFRKGIHIAASVFPLAIWQFGKSQVWWPLVGLTVLILVMDITRLNHHRFRRFIRHMFGGALRSHEDRELLGSSYLLLATLLVLHYSPSKELAVVSLGYLVAGDGLAGLVGKRYGRHHIAFGKSWEGTTAGFIANLLVGLMVFQEFPIALFGAVIASIIELLPMPLDDNLAIPIFCGGILWAGFF